MPVTHACLYYRFSLNFTTSGLLLQCFVSMKNTDWVSDNSSTWEAWRTTNPQGSSPERILHPNHHRLFKLQEIVYLRGITVTWLHDMKFYTDLHSSCDNSFYYRGIILPASCRQRTTVMHHVVLKNGNLKIYLIHCHIYTAIVNAFTIISH